MKKKWRQLHIIITFCSVIISSFALSCNKKYTGGNTVLPVTDTVSFAKGADISVTPEWGQVGNETNDGVLWSDGKAFTSMANFTQLVNAGYDAGRET